MRILRTDPERFVGLPDYPFAANWCEIDLGEGHSGRMHYVDEGDPAAPVILLLHGEPSWSYLYRHMIPPLVAAGLRVLAPDLIGFGKSDKPDDISFYTYSRHLEWVKQWVRAVVPDRAALFCQDWGGLIGLRMVADAPELFNSVVASNTFLPTGNRASEAFLQWREYARSTPEFPIGQIIDRGSVRKLSPEEIAAYDAPFPSEEYKAGARAFPLLVPVDADDESAKANRLAWASLKRFDRPFLTLFGDSDPVTSGLEKIFQSDVAGASGHHHRILENCGHFSQEDLPNELVRGILSVI